VKIIGSIQRRQGLVFCVALLQLGVLPPARAHEAHGKTRRDAEGSYAVAQKPFGIVGFRRDVKRTLFVRMGDDMRFSPSHIDVKLGETVRLVFRNKGKLLHEWVLGTAPDLMAHAKSMQANPSMHHDEVHMVHVEPGRSEELVWHFNREGSFQFACLMPAHYEAGMVGVVKVAPIASK
jgi:uncharacterized cupredoxin-like copper-binding protein